MQNKNMYQAIFDTVAVHLLTQNKPSVSKMSNKCMYRSDEGLKCAIGCLIPDEKYSPAFEGRTISGHGATTMLPDVYKNADLNFLTELQHLHDCRIPSSWKKELYYFASQHGLSPASAVQFQRV